MSSTIQEILDKIDGLNKEEMIKIFCYLERRIRDKNSLPKKQLTDSSNECLSQYILETQNNKRQHSLQYFRGIAPNLLEGQDAQEWVSQMRDEWEERERMWRKPE